MRATTVPPKPPGRFWLAIPFLILLLAGCMSEPAVPSGPDSPSLVTTEAIRFETEAGNITILLYREAAPETVALMVRYVAEGYYVGREFYRTVPGHVIQITDVAGGVTDDNSTVPLETGAGYHFAAGAVGIARGADPNSGGPEFFIMDFATSHLNGNYTVWGQVVEGMDVVHDIARSPAVAAPRLPSGVTNPFPFDRMAIQPIVITAATMTSVTLPAANAADYPLQVARNVRVGDYRHSLEWPADLAAGQMASMTWFIRPYGEDPIPGPDSVRVLVGGLELSVTGNPKAPGAYAFSWAPSGPGPHALTLTVAGAPWAVLEATAGPAN